MTVKERYDEMILAIEAGAKEKYKSANDLAMDIAHKSGLGVRDMSTVIRYLTDTNLLPYIKERKMMASYEYLIMSKETSSQQERSIIMQNAIGISGLDNQSSFSKRFKETFRITTTEALERRDKELLTKPRTWDSLSKEVFSDGEQQEAAAQNTELPKEDITIPKIRFGMPLEQYNKIVEATDLTQIYEFSPVLSEIAFELAETLEMPMEDTFRFVDSIRDYGRDYTDDEDWEKDLEKSVEPISPEKKIREIAFSPVHQHMFFACDLSVDLAEETRWHISDEEIMQLNPCLIHAYAKHTIAAGEEILFSYLKDAIEYYFRCAEKGWAQFDPSDKEDFENYIDDIYSNIPKETAFENNYHELSFEEMEKREFQYGLRYGFQYIDAGDESDDPFDFIERMDEEEERWYGKHF